MPINLNLIANYLIILLPAFLISGAFLSDLSVVLIDIIFLYILFKEKNFKFLNNNLFKFLLFFNFYISCRSLFADDLFFSLKSSLTYIRFSIFIFAIKFFLERDKTLLGKFSKILIFVIAILFSDSLFQYVNGSNFLGFHIENPDKLNSLFGDEGVMGSYLVRLLPLFLVCILTLKQNNYLIIFTIFIFGLFIFMAGSRASIALYILFFILFFFIFTKYRKLIFYYILIVSTVLILLSTAFNFKKKNFEQFEIIEESSELIFEKNEIKNKITWTIYYNLIDPVNRIFFHNLKDEKIIIFTEVYDSHYRTAFKMFKDNKYFGVGNKMFRKLCEDEKYYVNKFSCSTHPHNLYLQILAENGIIGFIFLLIIFSYSLFNILKEFFYRNFKKIEKIKDRNLILLLGIFINFWPIVPFGNFYNNWLSIVIYLPIGFLLYFRSKND